MASALVGAVRSPPRSVNVPATASTSRAHRRKTNPNPTARRLPMNPYSGNRDIAPHICGSRAFDDARRTDDSRAIRRRTDNQSILARETVWTPLDVALPFGNSSASRNCSHISAAVALSTVGQIQHPAKYNRNAAFRSCVSSLFMFGFTFDRRRGSWEFTR